MKFKQAFGYLSLVIAIYLILFGIDITIVNALIELFTLDFLVKLIVNIVCLLVINPILTYKLSELIPFKIHGLTVEEGLSEDLRKDVEL